MAAVRCPTCRTSVPWNDGSPFRPFCSERCKNIDLGAWASERYAIGGDPDEGQEGAADPDDKR